MLLKWITLLFFTGVLTVGKAQTYPCGYQTSELHGIISSPMKRGETSRPSYSCVWNITASPEYNILINITSFRLDESSGKCTYNWLTISGVVAENDTKLDKKMCGSTPYPRTIILTNRVDIKHFYGGSRQAYFAIEYHTVRVNFVGRTEKWISKNSEALLGDNESLPRALPALLLFDEAYFNKGNITGYKFKTQYFLKLSADLLRNSSQTLSVADLSHHVFALLSICSNPRSFHGIDLVQTLRTAIDLNPAVSKPFDLLTLCSSGENLTSGDLKKLNTVLNLEKENIYMLDFQAIAVMALICAKQENTGLDVDDSLQNAVESLTSYQRNDGSFGSLRSTVLIIQALSAAGAPEARWNKTAALHFAESKNNSDGSFGNNYNLYTVLPVLRGKTLLEINARKCDFSPEGVTPLQEVKDKMNELISLTYQLWVGDEAAVKYIIVLKFPNGTRFFDAMRLAAEKDPKYQLQWTFMKGDLYVYHIGEHINDPTGGKYWNLYTLNSNKEAVLFENRIEDYIPSDGDTAVMWYKTIRFPH